MIKVTIMYPSTKGAHFDLKYYLEVHMPMAVEALKGHRAYKGICVERGVAGAEPGSEAPYVAVCHIRFDTQKDFLEAFVPHAPKLQGDIPNYTNITPIIQISEVLMDV